MIWGLLTIYWKQLTGFNAVELIGWRIASASVVMAVVVTVRRRWATIRAAFADRPLAIRIAIAAALLTANWTAYVYAVVHDRVIETALGYFMAPLGTMVLGNHRAQGTTDGRRRRWPSCSPPSRSSS